MDDEFQAILDGLPPKPPRSRLEPYAELILEMRHRGRSYREIASVLNQHYDLGTAASTVHGFVQVRWPPDGKPAKVAGHAGEKPRSKPSKQGKH